MKKQVSMIGLLLVLILCLGGCMQEVPGMHPELPQPLQIGIYLPEAEADFVQDLAQGMTDYAVAAQLVSPEIQRIDSVQAELDVILTYATYAAQLQNSGAQVICLDTQLQPAVVLGEEIGHKLQADIQARAQANSLLWLSSQEPDAYQTALYMATAQHMGVQANNAHAADADAVAQYLEQHPYTGIVAADAESALWAQQAVIQLGVQAETCIFSMEYSEAVEKGIRQAMIYGGLLQDGYTTGWLAMQFADKGSAPTGGYLLVDRVNIDAAEVRAFYP